MARPWERLPREPETAYAAFRVYLEQPPHRRCVERMADPHLGPPLPEGLPRWHPAHYCKLSARWKWVERARAYDAYLQAARDREAARKAALWERRRQETLERHYELGDLLERRAREMIARPLERVTKTTDGPDGPVRITLEPARWTFRDAVAAVETAAAIKAGVLDAAASDLSTLPDETLADIATAIAETPGA
jgi:hypothetical protein